jgi:hypothetical protein
MSCLVGLLVLASLLPAPLQAQEAGPADGQVPLPYRYARVWEKPVGIYAAPGDPDLMTPFLTLVPPDSWVSIDEEVEQDGRLWYRVGDDAYVLASELLLSPPSAFQGVHLEEEPETLLGFVATDRLNVRARPGAGQDNPPVATLLHYDTVAVLGSEQVDDGVWYQIGEDQYVHGAFVRVVYPVERPADVPTEDRWIAVDLAQQTLAAFEGDRMVFATLISSGFPPFYTPLGLFKIWIKLQTTKMEGGSEELGDTYYLEDVPWTMYFSRDVGLHGAYWHDRFGTPRSHGCVNLSPLDAAWLFDWATPQFPRPDQPYVYASRYNPGTWVYVYSSG